MSAGPVGSGKDELKYAEVFRDPPDASHTECQCSYWVRACMRLFLSDITIGRFSTRSLASTVSSLLNCLYPLLVSFSPLFVCVFFTFFLPPNKFTE